MLKFNRLAKLSTDQNHIAEALKKSRLMQVSDDGTKIRRNPLVHFKFLNRICKLNRIYN